MGHPARVAHILLKAYSRAGGIVVRYILKQIDQNLERWLLLVFYSMILEYHLKAETVSLGNLQS